MEIVVFCFFSKLLLKDIIDTYIFFPNIMKMILIINYLRRDCNDDMENRPSTKPFKIDTPALARTDNCAQ